MATKAIHGASRKRPPYARQLQPLPAPNRALLIYTGSEAWGAAKRELGYDGYFVVLPFGDDPGLYRWGFVNGSETLIMGFGEPEPLDVIARLGGLLHLYGAALVVHSPDHGPITRIDVPTRRAA